MSAFQQLISSVIAQTDTSYHARIDSSWLQGRTAFGGVSTALVVAAMRQQVADERALRALSVSFVGPSPEGEHNIALRELRSGGSVTHMQGELVCDGEVATSVSAAFGKARTSRIAVKGPSLQPAQGADKGMRMPFIEGVTPAFTQHFDMQLVAGGLPFSGAESGDFAMWLRFKEPTPIDECGLIALADAPPMPGLNMIKPPGVGSSLSWYLEFPLTVDDMGDVDPAGWWHLDYRCQAASDGYYNNYATVWTPDGRPALFSRQVATVFEK
ncbi:MAG: thioesterase family protein [Spongiibacter sp.]|nr:thioesterase family protein [Spongiibacter sp.]